MTARPSDVSVRRESPADAAAVRQVVLSAFDDDDEADLVDALRTDPDAWINGLSWVAVEPPGAVDAASAGTARSKRATDRVVGHALLTRCHISATPALALAPCSVVPDRQRAGVGTAVTEAALRAARAAGERLVVVLGHPGYYPRFGFERASAHGVRLSMEVPDEAFMVLRLAPDAAVPAGLVRYASAFGL